MIKKITYLLLLSCIFYSCKPKESSSNALRLAIGGDPGSLDPRKGGDVLSSTLQFMLFEGLVILHPDGSISPAQCHSFTLSSDKKTYTFFLGKTTWSDGSPVTSYDFAKAWKKALSPTFPCPNAQLLYPIVKAEEAKKGRCSLDEVGIYTPDANTLVVHLKSPTPYFLELISFCSFFPTKEGLDELDPNWAYEAGKTFICNGPFCLLSWSHEKEMTLVKNCFYRAADTIKLEAIQISAIQSPNTALEMYKQGLIDFLGEPFSPLAMEMLPYIPKEEILTCPVGATSFIAFNTSKPPFSNLHIRKALSLAINREEIVQNILFFGEKAALSAVSPSLKAGLQKHATFYLDHQALEARKHLDLGLQELGLTKEEFEASLHYLYCHSPVNHTLAQLLQDQWKKTLNLTISLNALEAKTLIETLSKRNYTLAQTFYRAQFQDPISILERFALKETPKNYPNWENELYKNLVEQSFLQEGGERSSTLEEAETLLLSEMPLAPLYHWSLCYAKKPYVEGVELSPSGGIFFERLFLAKGRP